MPILIITEHDDQHAAQAISIADYNSKKELRIEIHAVADVFYTSTLTKPETTEDFHKLMNNSIKLTNTDKFIEPQ